MFGDGVPEPRYSFVDGNSAQFGMSLPLSSLYHPLILSQERYDSLVNSGLTPAKGKITVKIAIEDLPESAGIHSQDASLVERGVYAEVVPLSEVAFQYPIDHLELSLMHRQVTTEIVHYPEYREIEVVDEHVIEKLILIVHCIVNKGERYILRIRLRICFMVLGRKLSPLNLHPNRTIDWRSFLIGLFPCDLLA